MLLKDMLGRLTIFTIGFVLNITILSAQNVVPFHKTDARQEAWVDSTFRKLNRNERIAQLFFLRAHTNLGKAYEDSVANLIKRDKVGGLVFFQGGPGRQLNLSKYYQSISEVPLLIAQDAEWGLGMRLDSVPSYPYQMTLGAIQDEKLIYQMGRQIARDFKYINAHMNLAPVVDINNNPKNPVINYRSFGDNKYKVTRKAKAYLNGMQDEGLLVSIKHFPGHGDTDIDSHNDLPVLNFSRERLDSMEIYPFKELINEGVSGVMIAHMSIPSLDATPHLPSTLSKPIVTGLLKEELGFKGLVVSDAMEMKGVLKYFKNGEADVRAVIAGNDIIELSENTHRAIQLTRIAIRKHRLKWSQINESVKKILAAKYWAMTNQSEDKTDSTEAASFFNRHEVLNLQQKLAEAAVTVLNSDSLLKSLNPSAKTAVIGLGLTEISVFQKEINLRFPNSTNFIISRIASAADILNVKNELRHYDQIIVAIHDYRKRPLSSLGYNNPLKLFISDLARMNTITCLFANPYTIAGLPGVERSKTLLVNYQNSTEQQKASARIIGGEIPASGRLPVTINSFYRNGDGIDFLPSPERNLQEFSYE